jgi:hypothetical protein
MGNRCQFKRIGQFLLDQLGPLSQHLPGGGQRDPALVAVDEGHPGLALQLHEMLGHRGCGEVQQAPGVGDVAPQDPESAGSRSMR